MDSSKIVEKAKPAFYSDKSLWALIASNLVIIIWALIEEWSLLSLMWIYWSQSVTMGFFGYFKIMDIRYHSKKDSKKKKKPTGPTKDTRETARAFLFHYNFFHFGYFVYLIQQDDAVMIFPVLAGAVIFFIYQCYSYFHNKKRMAKIELTPQDIMLIPYIRIIPMHLFVFFANTGWGRKQPLVIFLLLKLFADALMHMAVRNNKSMKKMVDLEESS